MLIENQKIEMTWNGRTKKYYESILDCKGHKKYTWVKQGAIFYVDIEDLPKKSNKKVQIKCDYCGEIIKKSYNDYNRQKANVYVNKDSCSKCKGIKQIEVCQLKYGVNGVSQIKEIREKQVKTTIEKYGVENVSQNAEIKKKKEATFIERYGVENYLKLPECREQIKQNLLKKYGVEHHLQRPEIYQKQIETNKCKYGVENVFQSETVKLKSKKTINEKYGVDNISQVPEMTSKMRINANKSLYQNQSAPCSKQQKYLHQVLGGRLNYPNKTSLLDIAFPEDMIYIEFDGSGHNLSVLCGNLSQEEFDKREARRNYALMNDGWKIIRIISTIDLLPSDEVIKKVFTKALNYLYTDQHWIEFNIDQNIVRSSMFEETYDYGTLRKINKKDILHN